MNGFHCKKSFFKLRALQCTQFTRCGHKHSMSVTPSLFIFADTEITCAGTLSIKQAAGGPQQVREHLWWGGQFVNLTKEPDPKCNLSISFHRGCLIPWVPPAIWFWLPIFVLIPLAINNTIPLAFVLLVIPGFRDNTQMPLHLREPDLGW